MFQSGAGIGSAITEKYGNKSYRAASGTERVIRGGNYNSPRKELLPHSEKVKNHKKNRLQQVLELQEIANK